MIQSCHIHSFIQTLAYDVKPHTHGASEYHSHANQTVQPQHK